MKLATQTLKNWDQIQSFAATGKIFRGQSKAQWTEINFGCCFKRLSIAPCNRRSVEEEMLRESNASITSIPRLHLVQQPNWNGSR